MNASTRIASSVCPGCGLAQSPREFPYDGYYHASRECWAVYTGVLAREYEDAVLFGRVHQLTVDAYAAQHAGGAHPDKSVGVHLVGLRLALELDMPLGTIPPRLQQLVARVERWPHFAPPAPAELTVEHVALAANANDHAEAVRKWSASVWRAWSAHHTAVGELAALALR